MNAPNVSDYVGRLDYYGRIQSLGPDIARGLAFIIQNAPHASVEHYWRNKRAMLHYFARCREIKPDCVLPAIISLRRYFPEFAGKFSAVILLQHKYFQGKKIVRFEV